MKTFPILITAFLLLASRPGHSADYMSGIFCQPYKNGGVPQVESYYQNQGSVLAVTDTVFNCPIRSSNPNTTLQVRLYYSTFGVQVASPIVCRIMKISSANLSSAGQLRTGVTGAQSGALDLLSDSGPASAIGATIECHLKPGAKILSYYVY